MNSNDVLYRFVPDLKFAEAIAKGIYRFYDLTKYARIEDENGRADDAECSVTFREEEYVSSPDKLPRASFNGVEFQCISIKPDDNYISQYFVLCMSTEASGGVLDDSRYRVDIHRDQFELLSDLLNPSDDPPLDNDGLKRFSHGPVEYYDIDNHPTPIHNQRWKEVYAKHREFEHQHEYRAAFFISASGFERLCNCEDVLRRKIVHRDGTKMDFDLEFHFRGGRDADGWRYLEIDTCDFGEKINAGTGQITEL